MEGRRYLFLTQKAYNSSGNGCVVYEAVSFRLFCHLYFIAAFFHPGAASSDSAGPEEDGGGIEGEATVGTAQVQPCRKQPRITRIFGVAGKARANERRSPLSRVSGQRALLPRPLDRFGLRFEHIVLGRSPRSRTAFVLGTRYQSSVRSAPRD